MAEKKQVIPLYGFLEGDTIGLLILAEATELVQNLGARLEEAASIRVEPKIQREVIYENQPVDPRLTVMEAGFRSLKRFDVVEKKHS